MVTEGTQGLGLRGTFQPCLRVSFSRGLTGLFCLPGCHYGEHGMGQGGEQARGWGGRLRKGMSSCGPETSIPELPAPAHAGSGQRAGPAELWVAWGLEVWGRGHSGGKKRGHRVVYLSTGSDGLSLVHVLQQQVHSLRKVVHVPVSLYLWMMLIAGPGRQSWRLV